MLMYVVRAGFQRIQLANLELQSLTKWKFIRSLTLRSATRKAVPTFPALVPRTLCQKDLMSQGNTKASS